MGHYLVFLCLLLILGQCLTEEESSEEKVSKNEFNELQKFVSKELKKLETDIQLLKHHQFEIAEKLNDLFGVELESKISDDHDAHTADTHGGGEQHHHDDHHRDQHDHSGEHHYHHSHEENDDHYHHHDHDTHEHHEDHGHDSHGHDISHHHGEDRHHEDDSHLSNDTAHGDKDHDHHIDHSSHSGEHHNHHGDHHSDHSSHLGEHRDHEHDSHHDDHDKHGGDKHHGHDSHHDDHDKHGDDKHHGHDSHHNDHDKHVDDKRHEHDSHHDDHDKHEDDKYQEHDSHHSNDTSHEDKDHDHHKTHEDHDHQKLHKNESHHHQHHEDHHRRNHHRLSGHHQRGDHSHDEHHSHNHHHREHVKFDFATCEVEPNKAIPEEKQQDIRGRINLWQRKNSTSLHIHIRVKGFQMDGDHSTHSDDSSPSSHLHGFHVHQEGDLSDGCQSTGPHYNPTNVAHGGRNSVVRHVGDLGNISCDKHGVTNIVFTDKVASLSGPYSIIGRSLVIHEKFDDLGTNPDIPDSLTSGNAGTRIACCIIREVNRLPRMPSKTKHNHH